MPSFCRHNRLQENCPICSKKPRVQQARGAGTPRATPSSRSSSSPSRSRSAGGASTRGRQARGAGAGAGGMTVRRMARAVDDGYESELLPGVHASSDARRIAVELAASQARLDRLADGDGWYARACAAGADDGLWMLLQTAVIGPGGGDDPFAGLAACVTDWSSGDVPDLDAVTLGPRAVASPADAAAVLASYRALADRHGGQHAALGMTQPGSPHAHFDRAFERLSLRRLGRTQRIEFLVTAHALGLLDGLDPWSLRLADARALDPVIVAAKRLFAIGDPILLSRRLRALCHEADVTIAAADMALFNWGAPLAADRYLPGGGPVDDERAAAICAVLAVEAD